MRTKTPISILTSFVVMAVLLTACVSQEERVRVEKRKAETAARVVLIDSYDRLINTAKSTSGYSVSVVDEKQRKDIAGEGVQIVLKDEHHKWVESEVGLILKTLGYQEGGHNPIVLDFALYSALTTSRWRRTSPSSLKRYFFTTGTIVEASAWLTMDGFPNPSRNLFVDTEVSGIGRGYRPSGYGGSLSHYESCHGKILPTLDQALPEMLLEICESLAKMFPERTMAYNLVCDVEPIEQRMRSRFRLQENMDQCMEEER